MNKELMKSSYEWWIKLTPLWKKFVRETYLCGYDKEDLIQECYLQLVKALEKFDENFGVPFESYYKIQLYGWRANQNRRKKDSLSLTDELFEAVEGISKRTSDVSQEVENKLLIETIYQELDKMNHTDKTIVIGYYLKGRSLKEIANAIDINYKTAEFRKGKSLKRLRALFKDCAKWK